MTQSWLERCLVRVHGPRGAVVGAGLLIGPRHVVTCAHVVATGLGNQRLELRLSRPTGRLTVSFPAAVGSTKARVAADGWWPIDRELRGDVAVLEFDAPAPCVAPPLLCPVDQDGHEFTAKGFPKGSRKEHPNGVSAEGSVSGKAGPGDEWRQLLDQGFLIEPGFSGAPVWDRTSGAVTGILVANDHRWVRWRDRPAEAAFMIPLPVLIDAWEPLGREVGWRARFDPQRELHWAPRSRGIERPYGEEQDEFFTGRERVLGELAAWLAEPAPDRRARVVTGRAGAGKSAVLARLVMAADPDEAIDLETDPPAPALPPFALAIVAREDGRGLTLDEIVARIAHWTDVVADTAEGLVEALVARTGPLPTLAIDQLDEAARPTEVIATLLRPLAEAGARVLVGLSKEDGDALLGEFGETAEGLDLDGEYFVDDDLERYVAKLLNRSEAYAADPAATERVAAEVATRAHPLFLVAQLVALDLAEEDVVSPRPVQAYPKSVDAAMSRYVWRIARRAGGDEEEQHRLRIKVRDLMAALVYAQGAGLPLASETWPAVATALGGREYDRGSVEWLWSTSARFVMQLNSVGGATYGRLFHGALARCLTLDEEESAVQARIAAALAGLCPTGTAAPAPAYVEAHLSRHALLAGAPSLRVLAAQPHILDRLEPRALVADVRRAALRGDELPAELLGVLSSGYLMADSERGDRPGLRQLGMARISDRRRFVAADAAPELADWTVASAVLRRQTAHVTIPVGCAVRALASVPDRDGAPLLVAACEDHAVRAWAATNSDPVGDPLPGDSQLRALAACQVDGRPWVVAGDERGRIRAFDPEGGGTGESFDSHHQGGVRALAAFVVAGTPYVASAGDDGEVKLWARGDLVTRLPVRGPVRALTARITDPGSGGIELAAGADDGRVTIWLLGAAELSATSPQVPGPLGALEGPADWIRSVSLWGDGESSTLAAAGGDDGCVHLWSGDPTPGPVGVRLGDPGEAVLATAAFALPGGAFRLATAGADGEIRLWAADGTEARTPLRGHAAAIRALAAYPVDDAVSLASGGDDGTIRIWNPALAPDQDPEGVFHRDPVLAVAACATAAGPVAVTGDERGNIRPWDPDSGIHRDSGSHRDGDAVRVIVPYPAGGTETTVAAGGDDELVRFLDVATGKEVDGLGPLRGHTGPVRALSFESEAAAIVSGSEDGTVRLWSDVHEELDELTARPGAPIRGLRALHLPEHGDCLAVVGFGRALEIRLASEPATVVERFEAHTDWAMAVSTQAQTIGPRVLTCGDDGAVWLYDPVTRDPPRLLGSHDAPVCALAVLPGPGSPVVSGGDDGTVRIWDPDAETAALRCLRVGGKVNALCPLGERLLVGTDEGHVVIDLRRG